MVLSLLNASLTNPSPTTLISTNKFGIPSRSRQGTFLPIVSCRREPEHSKPRYFGRECSAIEQIVHQKSTFLVAASLAIVVWSNPAHAGFLSGSTGMESVPGPQLPQMDFLTRFNEENQKKYAENDARFKESPILKKLLEQSKLNKEKNKQEILDKYCIRGAEWGVGDCSADGMSAEDREKFIAMLKQKAGVE
ncbi:uncharacterized protein LOC130995884 [Salvia miltiorrhiza]|uniref:uncharacterized protein LOC130995884 n=1 Tax=Salvia miltiorrhiza TaxID=226208 RepID=UPI0025AC6583|nr:uncharacterized protein LOC130995884 [Salvia miltiorrhiza]XP_057777356.1 uncharacterized protein LOC130995884 [Salvia miltiorrhiza]